jgi:hypothetical protein
VPADDIFIVILAIVCAAVVAGAAVHSRGKHQAADPSEAPPAEEAADATEASLTESMPSKNANRRKRLRAEASMSYRPALSSIRADVSEPTRRLAYLRDVRGSPVQHLYRPERRLLAMASDTLVACERSPNGGLMTDSTTTRATVLLERLRQTPDGSSGTLRD